MSAATSHSIHRFDARYRLPPDRAAEARRLDRVLGRLVDDRLGTALDDLDVPSGDWLLRAVAAPAPVRLEDTDGDLAQQWAAAVARAVRQAISEGGRRVIHYPSRRAALLDLVCGVASGRDERAWAWERVGVRSRSDASPVAAPADAILAALCRAPRDALPTVLRAADRLGLANLDRALGGLGWLGVAEIVRRLHGATAQARVAAGARGMPFDVLDGADVSQAPGGARDHGAAASSGKVAAELASASRAEACRALAATIGAQSHFAELARRSRLRPDADRRAAWAVLAAVEVDPAMLRRADAALVLAFVASAMVVSSPEAPSSGSLVPEGDEGDALSPARLLPSTRSRDAGLGPDGESTGDGERDPGSDRNSPMRDVDTAAGTPPLSDAQAAVSVTEWGGLLFLLNVAEEIGLVERVVADPALASRSLRWILSAVARHLLALADDDPAALAFAGLTPDDAPPRRGTQAATDAEWGSIKAIAEQWAAAATARLPTADADEGSAIEWLCRRRGRVVGEHGWIEVHLRLTDVDVDVRRAGLDLDPGWIPWLGCVVRFVYGA